MKYNPPSKQPVYSKLKKETLGMLEDQATRHLEDIDSDEFEMSFDFELMSGKR